MTASDEEPPVGARFVRADLHVHSRPDSGEPTATPEEYIQAALAADLAVMAVTDHNAVDAAPAFMKAAAGTGVLVLPGIEISTNEGHLLAIFAPEALSTLTGFAAHGHLKISPDARDGSLRSSRSMADLVSEIGELGGLAIPAHIDAKDGINGAMSPRALAQLISSPGLAGIEFTDRAALEDWFTARDSESSRVEAWRARSAVEELSERGLARVMSSDAHSPEKVGGDRPSRTMTRLRLDEPTFEAVRNALVNNPKARCKAEIDLPQAYPRLERAAFRGGFLDGVEINFSPNLNAFIGGRGSGKSTALIAIRAALGVNFDDAAEDPDEPGRMPDSTTVTFLDRAGARRTALRNRGEDSHDPASGGPVRLDLADMGQGAAGRLARDYVQAPGALRSFLDAFVDLEGHRERQAGLLDALRDNGAVIVGNSRGLNETAAAEQEVRRLEDSMKAAETGRLEELARYALQLSAERALLAELDALTVELLDVGLTPVAVDLPTMASSTGTDLQRQPARDFVGTDNGVDALLAALATRRDELGALAGEELKRHATPLVSRVQEWKERHAAWQTRMDERQQELASQGLKVQAGEIVRVAERLEMARKKLAELQLRAARVRDAETERGRLLRDLHADREAEHERRKATLRRVVAEVNEQAEGLRIHVVTQANVDNGAWCEWLTNRFGFRQPRVGRIAADISPQRLAVALREGREALAALRAEGTAMLSGEQLDAGVEARTYPTIFELETMLRQDRVLIEVSESGSTDRRPFDHLSAGQQRSVLLSLLLSAERDQPLIVDQPEDHLDAAYIASSVVRQLEGAKERRQVIIATHSPNLTVLGDAELVIPMYASAGRGAPEDPGAVDRPATRERVCTLLEGGREAYRRRGARYGFDVRPAVR